MAPLARTLALAALLGLLPAPGGAAPPGPATPPAASMTAVLKDLHGRTVGRVTLTETPHGLLVRGKLSGVPRGTHALHFHETGKCEPPFKSAGGHFNPTQRAHGALDPGGLHAGDLPNLVVPRSGKLEFELFADALTLSNGPGMLLDVDGAALVLHARADDHHTQPSGDAGDRIACAVVSR